MTQRRRYLTKSLFVRALTCPSKLFYVKKPAYADNSMDNDFLEALAEGGFQVGELARCYFPGGTMIEGLDYDQTVSQTAVALRPDQAIVYEAAVRHQNLFIRADILVRDGKHLDLIEVKAKSYATGEEFVGKRGDIRAEWEPYLYDVAFQKYVIQLAYPGCTVRAHLMLADKEAQATVDGLNQLFKVELRDGRKFVRVASAVGPAQLGDRVLVQIPVDDIVNKLLSSPGSDETMRLPFAEYVTLLAEHYAAGRMIETPVGAKCKQCEFQSTPEQEATGLRSGFKQCWRERFGLADADLAVPNVFEIWNSRRNQDLIENGKFLLRDINAEDIAKLPGKSEKPGLTSAGRQARQLAKAKSGDLSVFCDVTGLRNEMASWRYPLHFIDFETSAMALPFHKGRHPYEGIAFQFSHHAVEADGRIRHEGQYINVQPGVFPNYEFVRALKRQLEHDKGTIFRYAAHENTYLRLIHRQMMAEAAGAIPDRAALCRWIETITESKADDLEWSGPRNMVDMRDLVLRYFYDPRMKGSNSIKAVLPAVLQSSAFLQAKYSQPVYGAVSGIPSLNYKDWRWVQRDATGTVVDPYHLLPKLDFGLSPAQMEAAEEGETLADGAAAMMAYARLQFQDVPDQERRETESALLRYCELDTMAMVLIWEHWAQLTQAGTAHT